MLEEVAREEEQLFSAGFRHFRHSIHRLQIRDPKAAKWIEGLDHPE
jgi:hypothetical protein